MKNERNQKTNYFTREDLQKGNNVNKIYVSLFGEVFELTDIYKKY